MSEGYTALTKSTNKEGFRQQYLTLGDTDTEAERMALLELKEEHHDMSGADDVLDSFRNVMSLHDEDLSLKEEDQTEAEKAHHRIINREKKRVAELKKSMDNSLRAWGSLASSHVSPSPLKEKLEDLEKSVKGLEAEGKEDTAKMMLTKMRRTLMRRHVRNGLRCTILLALFALPVLYTWGASTASATNPGCLGPVTAATPDCKVQIKRQMYAWCACALIGLALIIWGCPLCGYKSDKSYTNLGGETLGWFWVVFWDIACVLVAGCVLLFYSYGYRAFDSDFALLEAAALPNSTVEVILVTSQLPLNYTTRLVVDDWVATAGCRRFTEYSDLVNTAEQVGAQELLLFMLGALALSLSFIKKTQFTSLASGTFFSFFSARDPLKTSTWFQELEKAHDKLRKDQSAKHAEKLKYDVGSHVPDFLIWTCVEWSKFDRVVCSDALFMFALAVLSPLGQSFSKPCVGFGSNIQVKIGIIGHGYDFWIKNVDDYVDYIVKISLYTILVVAALMCLGSCCSPYFRQLLRQVALTWILCFSWVHALIYMETATSGDSQWPVVATIFRLVCLGISVLRLLMASSTVYSVGHLRSTYASSLKKADSPSLAAHFDMFRVFEEVVLKDLRLEEFTSAIKNVTEPGVKATLAKHFQDINEEAEGHLKKAYEVKSKVRKLRVVSVNHEVIESKEGLSDHEWFCLAGRQVSMLYKVKLDKVEGMRLGIALNDDLTVKEVPDHSLVGIWNRNHHATGALRRKVEKGDRIVTVNSITGTRETLQKQLEEPTMKIVLHHKYDASGDATTGRWVNDIVGRHALIYNTKHKIFKFEAMPKQDNPPPTCTSEAKDKPTAWEWAQGQLTGKESSKIAKLEWTIPVQKCVNMMQYEAEFHNTNFYKADMDVKVEGWRLADHKEAEAYQAKGSEGSVGLLQLTHGHVLEFANGKHKVRKEEYYDKPMYILLTKDNLSLLYQAYWPVVLTVLLSYAMFLSVKGVSSWTDFVPLVAWSIVACLVACCKGWVKCCC